MIRTCVYVNALACVYAGYMHVRLTLQREAAAASEAVGGVVSLSLRRSARECQKDSWLSNQLERGVTRQKEPLVLDKGCPATELRPSTPTLQPQTAAL